MPQEPDWLPRAGLHLEWPRLVAAVLARCSGASAKRRGVPLCSEPQAAALLLSQSAEIEALTRAGEGPLPLSDLRDVSQHLERLERHGTLEASALGDILATLGNARRLREFLVSRRDRVPALQAACSTDSTLDELEQQLAVAIEPDGTLSDRASDELRSLRTEITNLRDRIVGRLGQLIERYQDVLSDRYHTLREDRYVIPVRRDAHERVPGIVHGTSQSGASVFVEPQPIVAHGNRLKMAQAEFEREQRRILLALSERVSESLPSLRAAAEALDHADLRQAAARLAGDLGGSVPRLVEGTHFDLRELRHPLLVLDGVEVVPNDMTLAAGEGLVISGPNAGGKTVLLKALGLSALMARAGLPVSAAEGSSLGFVQRVLTDLGDEQSTVHNLSTFSAHIRNLSAILGAADGQALVLLDELASGTDPAEGGALACALVQALCERGAALAVTTHYEPLKVLSLEAPHLHSASMGFDVERMEPSFHLRMGVAGASSALAVARRFGIPVAVIEEAKRLLPESASRFEVLNQKLITRLDELERTEAALAEERVRLRDQRLRLQDQLQTLRKKGQDEINREVQSLRSAVVQARAQLEAARKELKQSPREPANLARAEAAVAEVATRVALGGDLAERAEPEPHVGRTRDGGPVDPEALEVGQRVYVPRLRSEATVVEAPRKGKLRIAVGAMKLSADAHELRALAPEAAGERSRASGSGAIRTPALADADTTLNVRGLRVDDALGMVESFVDRLYASEHPTGCIVHGLGSGALRDAVRKHLEREVPQVKHWRPGERSEGGDGVTIISFEGL